MICDGFKNTTATYFGATAVSVGNALQLRSDSLLTQGITLLFIIVFLGLYFRKKRAPFIILIPVVFGALFSLAAVYFIKGTISVIALGSGWPGMGPMVEYPVRYKVQAIDLSATKTASSNRIVFYSSDIDAQ